MTGFRMAKARVLEKTEQAHAVQLLETIGADVYVLGTRRPAGSRCPKCGTFVREHQGTCQTSGIADLQAFLPKHYGRRRILILEMKAADGRMSTEQKEYRDLCIAAGIDHVVGTFDAVIAWLTEHGYINANSVPHYRQPKGVTS